VAGSVKGSLVTSLRSRLSDERPSSIALTLSASGCKSAVADISNGFLNISITGGTGPIKSVRFDLDLPKYSTVGRLISELSSAPGIKVDAGDASDREFPSSELVMDGMPEIGPQGKATALRHYMFSDRELASFLEEACQVHNPNYAPSNVPIAEHPYVVKKAAAAAYRALAANAAKRRGLEMDVDSCLKLARDLEDQYAKDLKVQLRAVPVPKVDDSYVGSGHIMEGKLFRRSLRTGLPSSIKLGGDLPAPDLFNPADDDVEDVFVRLRWNINKDDRFMRYELWRDTLPEVERSLGGTLDASYVSPSLPENTQYSKPSTSKQVLIIYGSARTTIFAENKDTMVTSSFVDGQTGDRTYGNARTIGEPLESEMDYYYRLYSVSRTGEVVGSEVIHVKTKKQRGLFKRTSAGLLDPTGFSVASGPLAGGTTVTITGTGFEAGVTVTIGGKLATIVSVNSTTIVLTTPAFSNRSFIGKPLDIIVTSPNGLKDIAKAAWAYT